MSQAGELNVVQNHPDIPTLFIANVGSATPLANELEILGTGVITTTGAGNVITISATGANPETLTGNTGGAVPATANNINTLGTGSITIAGSPGTSTLTTQLTGLTNHNVLVGAGTATITNVSPSTAGFVLTSNGLAADPSFQTISASGAITTITGNTGGAESPLAGNFNIVGTGSITVAGSANTETIQLTGLTNHSLLVGAGTATITNLGVATNGQLPIGSTGADPVLANITSTAGTITVTNGPGTINIDLVGGGVAVDSFSPDSGTDPVVPTAAGLINDKGSGSITTVGSLNTITTQLTGLTNHAVLVGAGTATITKIAATANTGAVLQNNSGADPSYSTATYPSTTTINQILYSSAANTVTGLATANRAVLTTGATGVPVLTALATDGQLIIGSTAGAPAAATLTAGSGITITNASNSITIAVASGSVAVETLTGNSGGAISPSAGNINTLGTGSITIAGSGNTLTTQLTGLTNHNVLIGAGSATITNVAPSATSGVPLISQGAAADPVFGTAVVAGGGTGDTSFTAYMPITGGTSTTGALQSVATGTANYVLTYNTSSSLPTWQNIGINALTFSGDTGSAMPSAGTITFNAVSQAGSSVKFSGAGSTVSLNVTDGSTNTIMGSSAGNATLSGNSNTGFGSSVLNALTSGSQNTGCGIDALARLTTGTYNIGLGYLGGYNYTSSEGSNISLNSTGTTGESNVLRIGTGTGTGNQQLNKTFISGIRGITVTGTAVLVSASDQLGIAVSSKRFKENIQDMNEKSDRVMKLRPVTFNYIVGDDKSIQYGLIAEEVNEIFPEIIIYDSEGLPQTIQYHNLPVILLNEMKKMQNRIDLLEKYLYMHNNVK